MIPVATIGLLVFLIFVGALMARRSVVPRTITIGGSTIIPTRPESASGALPRGGFLNQGNGSAIKRSAPVPGDTSIPRDSIVPPDTVGTPPDTLSLMRL